MKKIFFPVLILLIMGALSGCQMSKLLRQHQSEMQALAYDDLSKKEKYHRFGQVMAEVLDNSATFQSPYKTFRYLEKFTQQNQQEVELVTKDLEAWINGMGRAKKLALVGGSLTKPYGRKLINVFPKVSKSLNEGGYKL
ncbi:MAG: hypothetical protein AAF206_28155, partial [Bacteroidota bacterium]